MAITALSSIYYTELSDKRTPKPTLNSLVTYDPVAEKAVHDRWSTIWHMITIASVVAFIALATAGFLITSLYFPSQLPVVALLTFIFYPSSTVKVVQWLYNKSDSYSELAKIDAKIIKQMNTFTAKQVQQKLDSIGVTPGTNPEKLKPLLARYFVEEADAQRYLNRAAQLHQQCSLYGECEMTINQKKIKVKPIDYTMDKVDFSNEKESMIFQELQRRRAEDRALLREAAICKLKAAYLLKLIENPYETKPFSHFAQEIQIPEVFRFYAERSGDRHSALFLKTPAYNYELGAIVWERSLTLAKGIFGLQSKV